MEIRRSFDRLISTMGFPILVWQHLYIESGPRYAQGHQYIHNSDFAVWCMPRFLFISLWAILSTHHLWDAFNNWQTIDLQYWHQQHYILCYIRVTELSHLPSTCWRPPSAVCNAPQKKTSRNIEKEGYWTYWKDQGDSCWHVTARYKLVMIDLLAPQNASCYSFFC